jgi:D-lactate dehydrogenase
MLVACFSTQPHDRRSLEAASAGTALEWRWLEVPLDARTAPLAEGARAVCCFVNDRLDAEALARLAAQGTRLVALRCAGFNQVDLAAADRLGMSVVRVPEYSPHAVAEHTIGLVLMLVRRLHKAYARVREGNFSLEGLLGFDLHGRTAGVVGTGRIGSRVAEILLGFGCRVVAHDPQPAAALAARGVPFLPLDDVVAASDILTLHCPLTPATHYLVDARRLGLMKRGAVLINTSRGGLVDTRAVIAALKSGHLGHLGLDVYEEEAGLFFDDRSDEVIGDDVFMRLLTFPNVVVTAHQAFFTQEALTAIADQTVRNLVHFDRGEPLEALVSA